MPPNQKPKKTSVYITEIKKQNWIKFPIICETFYAYPIAKPKI